MHRSPAMVAHSHATVERCNREEGCFVPLRNPSSFSKRPASAFWGGGSLLLATALLGTEDVPRGMQAEAAGDQPCALVQPLALPCINLKCCEVRGVGWGMLSKTCSEPLLDKSPWNLI